MTSRTRKASNIPTAPGSAVGRYLPPPSSRAHMSSRPPLRDMRNMQAVRLSQGNPVPHNSKRTLYRPQVQRQSSGHTRPRASKPGGRTVSAHSILPPPSSLPRTARGPPTRTSPNVANTVPKPLIRSTCPPASNTGMKGYVQSAPSLPTVQMSSSSLNDSRDSSGFYLLSDRIFNVDSEDEDDLKDLESLCRSKVLFAVWEVPRLPLLPSLQQVSARRYDILCEAPPQSEGLQAESNRVSHLSLPEFSPMEEDNEPEGLWYYFLSRESMPQCKSEPVSISESTSLAADSLSGSPSKTGEVARLWDISSDEEDDDDNGATQDALLDVAPARSARSTSLTVSSDSEVATQLLTPNDKCKRNRLSQLLTPRRLSRVEYGTSSTKHDVVASLMRVAENVKAIATPSPPRQSAPQKSEQSGIPNQAKTASEAPLIRDRSQIPTSRIPGYRQPKENIHRRSTVIPREASSHPAMDKESRNVGRPDSRQWNTQYSQPPRAIRPPSMHGRQAAPSMNKTAYHFANRHSLVMMMPATAIPYNTHSRRLAGEQPLGVDRRKRRQGMPLIAGPVVGR